jgi:hypothetical protein
MFGNGVILLGWGVPFVVFTELIVEARAVSNVECRMSIVECCDLSKFEKSNVRWSGGEIHNGRQWEIKWPRKL